MHNRSSIFALLLLAFGLLVMFAISLTAIPLAIGTKGGAVWVLIILFVLLISVAVLIAKRRYFDR